MQKGLYTSAAALQQKTKANTSEILEVGTAATRHYSKDTLTIALALDFDGSPV